ncbi:MAG TPA: branched-chain amino acid ABC transporter substrate-binding protein [Burkholderiales bacterium]|nr:branched-chain amino acid ABC transporter substrate-binding protein [Burkholderiales bacterium]
MRAFAIRFLVGATLLLQFIPAWPAETIRIALIGGLSGPYALQDEEFLKNVQMATDIVNTGGGVLGGKRLEILPFDGKANPQESLIALKRALDQGIRYVMSGRSNIALVITDAVAKHNARNPDRSVLFLNYNGLDPVLTESKCHFWHFRFSPHADTLVSVLTDQMAKQPSVRKVYLINQDYAFGQAAARAAKETLAARHLDVQVVGDDLIPLQKIKDFAPYVAKIRATGADSVLTGNWGSDFTLLIKAANEMGLKADFYTVAATYPGTAVAIGAAGAERVRTTSSWHINIADAAWQKTLLVYKTRYMSIAHLDSLVAIRPVQMIAGAFEIAGSTDPMKVAFALEGMTYAGPSGNSWMRAEDHQMIVPIYIMKFTKAGQPGVKFDEEGTGYGWKMEVLIEAKDIIPPMKCSMERPPR